LGNDGQKKRDAFERVNALLTLLRENQAGGPDSPLQGEAAV